MRLVIIEKHRELLGVPFFVMGRGEVGVGRIGVA
jgi:hypothetical protein